MKRILWTSCAIVAFALAAPLAAADDGALYHRFTIPARQAWGTVSIALAAQEWRVGSPEDPPASPAQLHAVLGNLGAIEIGGRCAGWVEASTLYPCGFALEALDFAGTVTERYAAINIDWDAPAESEDARAQRQSGELRRSGRADSEA